MNYKIKNHIGYIGEVLTSVIKNLTEEQFTFSLIIQDKYGLHFCSITEKENAIKQLESMLKKLKEK